MYSKKICLEIHMGSKKHLWEKNGPLVTTDLSHDMTIELLESNNSIIILRCQHVSNTNIVSRQMLHLISQKDYDFRLKPALLDAKWTQA